MTDRPARIRPVARRARAVSMLEHLRLSAGMTQEDLAQLTGLHRATISVIEGMRYIPSRRQLDRLADVLGAAAGRLLEVVEQTADKKRVRSGQKTHRLPIVKKETPA